jgi:hypothetical protein
MKPSVHLGFEIRRGSGMKATTNIALDCAVKTILALFMLACVVTAAEAIECKSAAIPGTYSQWRIIEGKRCWYAGKTKRAKSELHWSRGHQDVRAAHKRPGGGGGAAAAEVSPAASVPAFDERFGDLPPARSVPEPHETAFAFAPISFALAQDEDRPPLRQVSLAKTLVLATLMPPIGLVLCVLIIWLKGVFCNAFAVASFQVGSPKAAWKTARVRIRRSARERPDALAANVFFFTEESDGRRAKL